MTFANQTQYFLILTEALYRGRLTCNLPPEDMEEAVSRLRDKVDQLETSVLDGDTSLAHVENLADVAAAALSAAHAIAIPDVSEEALAGLLAEYMPVTKEKS